MNGLGTPAFQDSAVAEVFAAYPDQIGVTLLYLREVLFDVASGIPETGGLKETLKWGEPSYLPQRPRVGTTVRIGRPGASQRRYGLYVHCRTTLIPTLRDRHADLFVYDGNRGVLFDVDDEVPWSGVRQLVAAALTYHLSKRVRR
ncbi:MAG: DUF1801 domain-containing protein [Spirochaetales bacterium]|nr:DUF1801 domain-containing protein [Spirochaetales bacterium]